MVKAGVTKAKASDKKHAVQVKDTVPLQKQVGLFGGTALLVGTVIGSGIFVTPAGVYSGAGSVGMDLVIWGAAGLLSLIGGLCYVELGCLLPASGGDYAYLCAAGRTLHRRGDVWAFLYAWTLAAVGDPLGSAMAGLAFSSYALRPAYPECDPPYLVVILVTISFIALTTCINCFSVKLSAGVQSLLSSVKCLVLISIILTAAVLSRRVNHLNDAAMFANTTRDPSRLILAVYGALYSYSGWKSVNCVAAELKDTHRHLPRAIVLGLLTVTVIYILTNLAYFVCLNGDEILSSEAVAVSFARLTWGSSAALLVPVFVAISTFGSATAGSFTSSRVTLAAARQGHLPRFLSYVHVESAVPVASTLLRAMLGVLFAMVGSLQAIIVASVFLESIFDVITIACLFVLRHTMKDAPRTYTVPTLLVVVRLLVSIALAVIPLIGAPSYAPYALVLVIILAGLACYWMFLDMRLVVPGNEAFSNFVQKLLYSAPCTDELEHILAPRKAM